MAATGQPVGHSYRPAARWLDVLYLSEHPKGQRSGFSGIPFWMYESLVAEAGTVQHVQTPLIDLSLLLRGDEAGWAKLLALGSAISAFVNASGANVVICQGSVMIPGLRTRLPTLLWHDSTWEGLLGLSHDTFRHAYPLLARWDRRVVESCNAVVYAAEWVESEARRLDADFRAKTHVVPFGPSFSYPSTADVAGLIAGRGTGCCRLAFVGADWRRKGLARGYELMLELNRLGLPATLDVVGVARGRRDWNLSMPYSDDEFFLMRMGADPRVTLHGYVHKDGLDEQRFIHILGACHFLVHPAERECFGVALIEANALGVPVLAMNVQGPASIVRPGINGYVYDAGAFVDQATKDVVSSMRSAREYLRLAVSARRESETRLNWRSSVRRVLGIAAGVAESGR